MTPAVHSPAPTPVPRRAAGKPKTVTAKPRSMHQAKRVAFPPRLTQLLRLTTWYLHDTGLLAVLMCAVPLLSKMKQALHCKAVPLLSQMKQVLYCKTVDAWVHNLQSCASAFDTSASAPGCTVDWFKLKSVKLCAS